jgi:hypothetical protein
VDWQSSTGGLSQIWLLVSLKGNSFFFWKSLQCTGDMQGTGKTSDFNFIFLSNMVDLGDFFTRWKASFICPQAAKFRQK